MGSNKYILKGKKAIPVDDVLVWAHWFEHAGKKRIVKQETLPGGELVSTVFLGLDYSFGGGRPLLFETMVFPNKVDFSEQEMDRYSTWEEAEAGHKKMVEKWTKKQVKK